MSLKKLFNFDYLFQNIKKSKALLLTFILLVPILSSLLIVLTGIDDKSTKVFSLSELSIVGIPLLFIVPLLLSIALNGYVYKRRSVDFIGSMPINKSTIFITNTLGGLGILFLMFLTNIVLFGLISIIFSNIYIPFALLFDYFVLWFVSYSFVFIASNLAMSVSGNMMSQIVVTLLILFLVPYIHFYTTNVSKIYGGSDTYWIKTTEENTPTTHSCALTDYYDSSKCAINKKLNVYYSDFTKVKTDSYTMPFNLVSMMFNNSTSSIYNSNSITRMIILSIIYFILGLILFNRRKMEVCETSFRSPHIHNIVKCLTLIPLVSILYLITESGSTMTFIFVLVLIFIYSLIYDLITKRNLNNMKLSLIYFIVSVIVIYGYSYLITTIQSKEKYLDSNDFISASVNNYNYTNYNDELSNVYIKDKELINILVKNHLSTNDGEYILKANIKDKHNNIYSLRVNMNEEDYNKIIDILSNDKNYNKEFKKFVNKKVYAITLGYNTYSYHELKHIINYIKELFSNITVKDYLSSEYNENDKFNIELYTYDHHNLVSYRIDRNISDKLNEMILDIENNSFKNTYRKGIDGYYHISIVGLTEEDAYYIVNESQEQLLDFIDKNIDEDITIDKKYLVIDFYIGKTNSYYHFYTNKVEEIYNLISERRNVLKDTTEYKEYFTKEETEDISGDKYE